MRGAPDTHGQGLERVRIIPADAGSTEQQANCSLCAMDHPRGCGEHMAMSLAVRLTLGSSPRMRGAHRDRLIPMR